MENQIRQTRRFSKYGIADAKQILTRENELCSEIAKLESLLDELESLRSR